MLTKSAAWLLCVSTIVTQSSFASAQSEQAAPQATPQQAIDFIKQKVEQYSGWSCHISTYQGDATHKTLVGFDGPTILIQSVETTEGGELKGKSVESARVSLEDVSNVDVKARKTLPGCNSPAFYVSLTCKEEHRCATKSLSDDYRESEDPKAVRKQSSSSIMMGEIGIPISDASMAQRVAKAIHFYRKAVAAAPSPF